jgi:hypothetical protein
MLTERAGRAEIAVPALWALGTVAGLVTTLWSLRNDDFDGLNNILQLPFAFPWVLLPTAIWTSHYQDAWVLAGEGLLNAVLLHRWLRRRRLAGDA